MCSLARLVISCSILVLWQLPSIFAANSTDQPTSGYGFELLVSKLDFLHYRLLEVDLKIRDRDEEAAETKLHQQQVLESLVHVIARLDQAVGHNLTALQADSWKLLAQQAACASHTQMRQEMFNLAPKEANHAKLLRQMETLRYKNIIRSCKKVPKHNSGVYLMQTSDTEYPFAAFCEQDTYGGGWLVIQHRFDGLIDFYRNWSEYRKGFGSADHEFWLGLEKLHQLTAQKPHELLVEVWMADGTYGFAHYKEFEIGSEMEQYSLKKLGAYDGTAGDSLTPHKGMKFSTNDRDNDVLVDKHLATLYEGPWWYKDTYYSNLNGRYLPSLETNRAFNWYYLKTATLGLSASKMMIREL